MAINIRFDLSGNPEPPTIILATRSGNKLGQLYVDPESINLSDKLNDASEFTFTLNKYIDNKVNNLWDKAVNFKLVYCDEWDTWFEITVEIDEETETTKTVFCKQLGQAELSQIMLYNIEINTEEDIARDDYKISILWCEDDVENKDKDSILRRLLEKAPHYSIAHVDSTIANIQRSFSFDDISIYDAFQEIAEEIGCLFIFNSGTDKNGKIERTISVYDLYQNCNICGHRGEFTEICPNVIEENNVSKVCGSTDIEYGYGEDTSIFVTSDELASSGIELTTDTDSVKNCFKLEAGDDLMTATIRNCNPNGTDYIWRFSDDMKEDMSDELVEKIDSYDSLYRDYYFNYVSSVDSNLLNQFNNLITKYSVYDEELKPISSPIKGYSSLMNAYYDVIDLELYLKSSLMPTVKMSKTTASDQATLLTISSLSPVSVTDKSYVSLQTANNAVLAMAKVIISPTYKIQITSSELSRGVDSVHWSGTFVITNYSDEEDTATRTVSFIEIDDDVESFVKQKLEKALNKENSDDLSITGLFKKDYDDFCDELKKYALTPLTSFRDACQACIDILIEQGVASGDSWSDSESGSEGNLYEKLYVPYYQKLTAIEAEMKVREDEINIISGVYDLDGKLISDGLKTNIEQFRNNIQDVLNFEDYLGNELWLEFCAYRREDKYSNDNYISDGLDNAELFKRALEFFDVAENEIYKASEQKHSISTSLNNLLAIPKFKELVQNFKVGNWIRVQVDDEIYKLRLLEYEIDFSNFDNIQVEFSDVAKIKNGITDVESILSQASSIASSYGSVQHQANKGNDAEKTISEWLESGLNSALIQIQNNNSEEITLSKSGLLGRSYSDITESYSPKQIKLTHNILAYTDNDWESVRMAIGEHDYKYYDENGNLVTNTGYGISAQFVQAGYISGSQIIGGDVYSDNYSKTNGTGSYLNLRDGTFSFGGGSLRFEGGQLIISSPDIPTTETITEINEQYLKTTTVYAENLQVKAANIEGQLSATQINTVGLIAENISSTIIDGKTINGGELFIGDIENTYAEITSDGVLTCSGANINGDINGSNITGGSLFIGNKEANWFNDYNPTYAEIDSEGVLTCTNANISGSIVATSGIIGDCMINNGILQVSSANITGSLTASEIALYKYGYNPNNGTYEYYYDRGNSLTLDATGVSMNVDNSSKFLIGTVWGNTTTEHVGIRLGYASSNPVYIIKWYHPSLYKHLLWIGDYSQNCGILFDFTNGIYQLKGTQGVIM